MRVLLPRPRGLARLHLARLLAGLLEELFREHDRAIDGDREPAVAPAEHDGAYDQFRDGVHRACERVVRLGRSVRLRCA